MLGIQLKYIAMKWIAMEYLYQAHGILNTNQQLD